MANIIINLTFSLPEFQTKVTKAMVKSLNDKLFAIGKKVERRLGEELKFIFTTSATYQSIIGNVPRGLDAHFGIPKGTAKDRMDVIIDVLQKDIKVRRIPIKFSGNKITSGGFKLVAYKSDFASIISLQESEVFTEKGVTLPWLEWLLFFGDQIIIADYDVDFGDFGVRSRSGKAIMVKESDKMWQVPPEYSGTETDNWITRSLFASVSEIRLIVGRIFNQSFEEVFI